MEIWLGAPGTGTQLGELDLTAKPTTATSRPGDPWLTVSTQITTPPAGRHALYFRFAGGPGDSARMNQSLPADVFEAGNLSALEDAEPSSPQAQRQHAPTPQPIRAPQAPAPHAQPMLQAPMAGMPAQPLANAPGKRGGSGATVGVVVFLAAAVAVAAAWFTHLIPH